MTKTAVEHADELEAIASDSVGLVMVEAATIRAAALYLRSLSCKTERVEISTGPVDVDQCIAPIVSALNAAGITTVASCCGHKRRPGNIALKDGRELIIAQNYEQGRAIDRAFPSIYNAAYGVKP